MLRAFSVWTVLIWIMFIKNVVIGGDGGAAARAVHSVLAIGSILFAIVSWQVVTRVRAKE